MTGLGGVSSSETEPTASQAAKVRPTSQEGSLYGQFCPIAMAAELLATRWTLIVLGEMLSGSTRFNEIRRGMPKMSSALLAKRLKELEAAGVVAHCEGRYGLTPAGLDLAPIVQSLGRWALRWVDSECSLSQLDVRLLMWNMRRNLRTDPMPARKAVIEFRYPELSPQEGRYWLIVAPRTPVDLCSIDPGYEIDVLVTADLKSMTSAWMGLSDFSAELGAGQIVLAGDAELRSSFVTWIGRSGLAPSKCEAR